MIKIKLDNVWLHENRIIIGIVIPSACEYIMTAWKDQQKFHDYWNQREYDKYFKCLSSLNFRFKNISHLIQTQN